MNESLMLGFVFGLIIGLVIAFWLNYKSKKGEASLSRLLDDASMRLDHASKSLLEFKSELTEARTQNLSQNTEIATLTTSIGYLEQKLTMQKEEMGNTQVKMNNDFENLTRKIFEQSSKQISEQSRVELDRVLLPFRDKIKEFENKVEHNHIQDAKDRAQLIEKITHLSHLNTKMQEEAKNLTTALKGDTQKQGSWGEMILENVLEYSGLTKGSEYYTQSHLMGEDGKRYRPDVVVNLPDNKHVIIDSKVSLKAYEAAVSSDSDEETKLHVKKHLLSVKSHIKELNQKNYQNAKGVDSPDFVLMFMPIEASFSLAVKEDAEIYNYAWTRKVVIVSPSTLLATLKTISSLWKQEKQNRNAIEIAQQAGALYDKFVGFTKDMVKIEQQLDTTSKTFRASMNKLTSGKGNLIGRAEKIRKLGAKTTKDLNPILVEHESDNAALQDENRVN